MPAGSTYTPIATTTLGSAAASLTWSSIPSTYTDLVFVIQAPSITANQDPTIRFNSDSGTNYSRTWLAGNGTTASSSRQSNKVYAYLTYVLNPDGTNPITYIGNIMNYSNSTTYKTMIVRGSSAAIATETMVHLWRSTSAITQIDIAIVTGTMAAGTQLTLYGIASA